MIHESVPEPPGTFAFRSLRASLLVLSTDRRYKSVSALLAFVLGQPDLATLNEFN